MRRRGLHPRDISDRGHTHDRARERDVAQLDPRCVLARLTEERGVACALQAKEAAEEQAASARAEAEAARSEAAELQSAAQGAQGPEAAVHRLVELMYFAAVSPRPHPAAQGCLASHLPPSQSSRQTSASHCRLLCLPPALNFLVHISTAALASGDVLSGGLEHLWKRAAAAAAGVCR